MTSPGDWVISPQNVSAPPFLDLNSAGIVLGPDVPPCMSAFYSAVWRFQPAGAATGGLNAPPSFYIGQVLTTAPAGNERIDFGALIYDGLAVCGWRAMATWQIQNRLDGLGTLWPAFQFGGFNATSPAPLPAFFRNEFNIGDTSGPVSPPVVQWNFNKGDPLTRQPNPNNVILTCDSVSMPRGKRLLLQGNPALSSAGAGTSTGVESGVFSAWTGGDTSNSRVWYPNRVWKVTMTVLVANNGGYTAYLARLRSTLSNTILGNVQDTVPDNQHLDQTETQTMYLHNATGSAVTTGFQVSLLRTACSVAGATCTFDGCIIDIEDYAATSDFTNLNFSNQIA